MATNDRSPWFVLGKALGSAGSLLSALDSNPFDRAEDPEPGAGGGGAGASIVPRTSRMRPMAGVAGAAVLTALDRWLGRRRPPLRRLVRGAVAGAGAAGILVSLRAVLDHDEDTDLIDEVLAGAGKGVIYASLVDPFLPGPPVARGALAGTLDYLISPTGGIYSHLQSLSPARKLPMVSVLLEAGDAEDDPYLSFLCYGVALGLLYGEAED